jgi:hypothetical protein
VAVTETELRDGLFAALLMFLALFALALLWFQVKSRAAAIMEDPLRLVAIPIGFAFGWLIAYLLTSSMTSALLVAGFGAGLGLLTVRS